MTKSDLAQEAARHLRELVVVSGRSSEELLRTIPEEYEIEANVVRAWLLRDFESLEALDAWGATRREEIRRLPELERERLARRREELDAQLNAILRDVAVWLKESLETDRNRMPRIDNPHATIADKSSVDGTAK